MSRYKFQEKFSEIGEKNKDFSKKTVAIIGVGGLGSIVADMLNREGIPLKIIDKGRVAEQDFQRQTAYLEEDDTKFKAKQIKKRLDLVNKNNNVKTFHEDLISENLFLLDSADVVVDCSNNLNTMNLVANYIKKKQHLINCKYAGSEGAIFISDKKCTFNKALGKAKIEEIKEKGIINATTHLAAGIIVAQVLKILVRAPITDNLIVFDVWKNKIRRVSI